MLVEKIIFTVLSFFYGFVVSLILIGFHLYTRFKHIRNPDHSKRPAILDDPKYGKHHTVKTNNKSIHYVAKGNPDDPIIVFLHGFPDFWFTWRDQLVEFSSKGYYAVAIDIPGYGESSKILEPGQRRVDILVEDLVKVIQTITKSPEKKITLVGHDWGAALSFYLAHDHPNLVEKLVIINGPHPVLFKKMLKSSLKQFLCSWYMMFFGLPYLPEFAFQTYDLYGLKKCFVKADRSQIMSESEMEPWKYIYSQPGALTSTIGIYRDNIGKDDSRYRGDLRIRQPLMVIWGDSDFALTTDLASGTAKYADNLRLRLIKGAGHFVPLEEPKKVNSCITEFLNEFK